MKKLIPLIVLFSTSLFAQTTLPTKFEVTKEGFTDFTVINVEGKSKEEIYTKTLEWINKTYNTPKEVIKAEIVNDYIRFEGIKKSLFYYSDFLTPFFQDVRYMIEVSVKDNKFKFDIISLEVYSTPSQYSRGGWYLIMSNNVTSNFYKNDGTLRNVYKEINRVPDYFNSLQDSLKEYILNGQQKKSDSSW